MWPSLAEAEVPRRVACGVVARRVGLYKILPLPILLYIVYGIKVGVGEASYIAQNSCHSIAIV